MPWQGERAVHAPGDTDVAALACLPGGPTVKGPESTRPGSLQHLHHLGVAA